MGSISDECMDLPPGFRFHPTDEEIISHYLTPKVINHGFNARAVGQVDLNKCEPWDLPSKAKMGEKEWYFFCQRDRKYPTGMRTNRATESGYWKATGKDKEIFRGKGVLVGMKKTLVFYRGRAPKGEKTNWVMHEYRLEGRLTPPLFHNLPKTAKDEWVVSRVFHKSTGVMVKKSPMVNLAARTNYSFVSDHELLDSTTLPPLMDPMAGNFITDHGEHHDGFYFKGLPTSSNTPLLPSNYFLSSTTMLPKEEPHQNNNNNIINQPLYPQLLAPCSSNLGYLHHDQALIRSLAATSDASSSLIGRQCKVEQLSNQSMLSQDTGLSTDRNTEISSVNVSRKHEINNYGSSLRTSYEDLDLENLWKY